MDKASILGDTIEYVKQLRKKIQDLEARTHQMEADQRSRAASSLTLKEQRSGVTVVDRARVGPATDKRKLRIVEASGGAMAKAVESPPPPPPPPPPLPQPVAGEAVQVQVSIIESDALVELNCPYKEGLLLDVMQMLRELRVEITTVQSSLTNGVFVAEMRAKVKENINGKKTSIVEVKRAIHQIIPPGLTPNIDIDVHQIPSNANMVNHIDGTASTRSKIVMKCFKFLNFVDPNVSLEDLDHHVEYFKIQHSHIVK
ncbi:hypothetical protein F0562_021279 [Nyssa sinensis]|uniref:Plant bHLH transcription factor ACT-like domain-containing protein n=1 Tax=Nyssa sinensis TaxID=561372 RepID=A0A5J5BKR0_9ASTE|nr:hypothetical protein F0562_021279 [Nyssa sinensis]